MKPHIFIISSTDKNFMLNLIDFLNDTKIKECSTNFRLIDKDNFREWGSMTLDEVFDECCNNR